MGERDPASENDIIRVQAESKRVGAERLWQVASLALYGAGRTVWVAWWQDGQKVGLAQDRGVGSGLPVQVAGESRNG
jgi:hypothetical protein